MAKKENGRKKIFMTCLLVLAITACVEIILECSGLILFGVEVDGVAVGGCTRNKAMKKLTEHFAQGGDERVILEIEDKNYTYTKEELGMERDIKSAVEQAYRIGREGSLTKRFQRRKQYEKIEIVQVWSRKKFLNSIEPLVNLYNTVPADARLRSYGDDGAIITEESNGKYIDVDGIFRKLQDSGSGDVRIKVQFRTWYPYPTEEIIQGWQLNEKLCGYATTYDPESNRGKNIELFAGKLNGTVLYPYEIFSVNERAGERSAAKGYLEAPIVIKGRLDNDVGGGICQVVSTLYNAVLQGDFAILERHSHSKAPEYVEPGKDATVSYGQLDFRCYYKGKSPVLLNIIANDGYLLVQVCGKS